MFKMYIDIYIMLNIFYTSKYHTDNVSSRSTF
jgi:hypothetical protein